MPSKNIQNRTEALQKFDFTHADIVRIFNDNFCALDSVAENGEVFNLYIIKPNGTEFYLKEMPPDTVLSVRFKTINIEPTADQYTKIDITLQYPNIKGKGGIRISGISKTDQKSNIKSSGGVKLGGVAVAPITLLGGVEVGGSVRISSISFDACPISVVNFSLTPVSGNNYEFIISFNIGQYFGLPEPWPSTDDIRFYCQFRAIGPIPNDWDINSPYPPTTAGYSLEDMMATINYYNLENGINGPTKATITKWQVNETPNGIRYILNAVTNDEFISGRANIPVGQNIVLDFTIIPDLWRRYLNSIGWTPDFPKVNIFNPNGYAAYCPHLSDVTFSVEDEFYYTSNRVKISGGLRLGGTGFISDSKSYSEIGSGGVRAGSSNTYYGRLFDRTPLVGYGVRCTGEAVVTMNVMELIFNTNLSNEKIAKIAPKGTVNIKVYWGDGTSNTYTTAGIKTHNYINHGIYNVIITGTMTGWGFDAGGFSGNSQFKNLLKVISFGKLGLVDMSHAFENAFNLIEVSKNDFPTTVTNLSKAFYHADNFNYNISNWDVSSVTNFSGMFDNAISFNQDISSWNTSSATNMSYMFNGAEAFNQPLNNWNVSNVTNMNAMFSVAKNFNQPLNNWNTSKVTNMSYMFQGALVFNQDISNWNTSSVTNMSYMFPSAEMFNQPLNSWNVYSVTNMAAMFYGAKVFNQPLNSWNVSKVTNMSEMFAYAPKFNQSLNSWNVSKVNNMSRMFEGATVFNGDITSWSTNSLANAYSMFYNAKAFNQPIGSWNVSAVDNMGYMFTGSKFNQPLNSWNVSNNRSMSFMFFSTPFNQPLNNWNVSKVENLFRAFASTPFNQNISNWNTSSCTIFARCFENCSSFNQDLSNWNFNNTANADTGAIRYMIQSTAMSVTNINNLLVHWDNNKSSLPDNLLVGILPNTPTGVGLTAKTSLETNKGWGFY